MVSIQKITKKLSKNITIYEKQCQKIKELNKELKKS